jgi:hypothetical protein
MDKMGVTEAIEEPSGKLGVEDSSVDEETPVIKIELNKDKLLVTRFGTPCTQYLFLVSKKTCVLPEFHVGTYARPKSKLSQPASKS